MSHDHFSSTSACVAGTVVNDGEIDLSGGDSSSAGGSGGSLMVKAATLKGSGSFIASGGSGGGGGGRITLDVDNPLDGVFYGNLDVAGGSGTQTGTSGQSQVLLRHSLALKTVCPFTFVYKIRLYIVNYICSNIYDTDMS